MLLLAWWTHYLNTVFAAILVRSSLLLLLLLLLLSELSGYYANAVRRHVYSADVLVRLGVDKDDFR